MEINEEEFILLNNKRGKGKSMKKFTLLVLVAIGLFFSCKKDAEEVNNGGGQITPNDTSLVTVDLDLLPYDKLSDYNLFQGDLHELQPQNDVYPYDILSHLFTDYAKKERFIWMPDTVSATYTGDGEVLSLPIGTVIIKNFYYDNVQPLGARRVIETRLLIRTELEWMFADYIWNEDQTEAFFDVVGSFTDIQFINELGNTVDVNYRIPSETECNTCHNVGEESIPIGLKPQSLNMIYDYPTGSMNQLDKWEQLGLLSGPRPSAGDIETVVDWRDQSQDIGLRVRSYVDINCSHCHSDGAYCDYRPMRFAFDETGNPDNLGICIPPDDQSLGINQNEIVSAGFPENSMLYYRISSINEAERMPLTGRTIVHEEAKQMIEEWISALSPPCD
ncbi:MAG: putative repeat protein (TIGR03806 family) [Gammaproteobacteria bacterium]